MGLALGKPGPVIGFPYQIFPGGGGGEGDPSF